MRSFMGCYPIEQRSAVSIEPQEAQSHPVQLLGMHRIERHPPNDDTLAAEQRPPAYQRHLEAHGRPHRRRLARRQKDAASRQVASIPRDERVDIRIVEGAAERNRIGKSSLAHLLRMISLRGPDGGDRVKAARVLGRDIAEDHADEQRREQRHEQRGLGN